MATPPMTYMDTEQHMNYIALPVPEMSCPSAHFQAVEFRDELQKFGMIGFDRLGRREVSIINPFARRHVYKVRDNLSQAHP